MERSRSLRLARGHGRIAGILALAAASWACASGGTPRPFPTPGPPPVEASRSPKPRPTAGGEVVATALALRGAPYKDGGTDPAGFDCSGFTQYVYARHAVALPRAVRDQFQEGRAVTRRALAPGDLLFFAIGGRAATHVAIAIDAERFVHAPSATGVVRVERLTDRYWSRRFLGARRIQ
jgi:cell wall-associated NlpC family hydrolase